MAGTIIGTPNSPPTVDADWTKVINNYTVGGKGQNSISLTEWATANTTKPAVEAGSTIEVAGSFAEFTATVIGDDGSLVTGTIYLYIDVTTTPGSAIPTFTNTAPTWNAAKQGWYNVAGDRYTGHVMSWDGATSYTLKGSFLNMAGGINFVIATDGSVLRMGTDGYDAQSEGVIFLNDTNPWVPPAGMYMVVATNSTLQVYVNGVWHGAATGFGIYWSGTIIADGTNMRIYRTDGAGGGIYYRKIW